MIEEKCSRPALPWVVREHAKAACMNLMWFAILQSTDPREQKLLDRLQLLQCQIEEIMDVLAPGWEK